MARLSPTLARQRLRQSRGSYLFIEPLEDRRLLAALVFGGIDDSAVSPTNADLIIAADLSSGRQFPLHAQVPFTGTGISGVAFRSHDQFFAATSAGPGSSSSLIGINPATGVEFARVPITAGTGISIGDLAVKPDSGEIYGVRSADDGGNRAGEIYRINSATGVATLIGRANIGPTRDSGLAFKDATTLYYTSVDAFGTPVLHTLNVNTAQIESTVPLTGSLGQTSGLAYWPEQNTLVGTGAGNGELVRISVAGVRAPIDLEAPARGIWGDLDFMPAAPNLTHVYHEDFENGDDGSYTAENTFPDRQLPGYWHFSLGRFLDGLLNHSPTHSWYYGAFETPTGGGRYSITHSHRGVLTSPTISLPDSGTSILSFSYLLDTRPALNVDFVTVEIKDDAGLHLIKSRASGTLPQTGRDKWLTSTEDISRFNGKDIQVVFTFDTGDVPPFDPEGWYVDDVQISNFAELGSISGAKFNDLNGNGVRDQGEPGIAGWTIFVDADNDGTLDPGEQSATTDAQGNYTLSVGPGTYRIREVLKAGWEQLTANPADITVTSGQEVLDVNFGNFELVDITGLKFNDLNGNGVRDQGEPGIAGWTIFVDADHNGTLDPGEQSDITDADGNYTLTVGHGTHRVREVLQVAWEQITANPADITVSSGQNVAGVNFGNFELVDITGLKFNDLNGNGVRDQGEPGIAGWTIFVDADHNGTLDPGEQSDITDALGNYTLTVGHGTHRIREVLKTGWEQLTENPADITVTSGQNVAGVNFGNFELVDITGLKFNDLNASGVQDPGEPGLQGWTIFVDADHNGTLDPGEQSDITDADGNYTLTVGHGTHRIREVLQAGWEQRTPNPADIPVSSGQNVAGVNFGNALLAAITGRVFIDVNGNAVFDADLGAGTSEAGIPNVTIRLLDAGMNVIAAIPPQNTGPAGTFEFTALSAGDYFVDVVSGVPMGFSLTTGFDPLMVNVPPGATVPADFGYQGVIQFGTALSFFRSGVPADLAFVPFVRPADQPLFNLLEDPDRTISGFLAFLNNSNPQSYQVLHVENTSQTQALQVTNLSYLLQTPGSADFIRVYTQQQIDALIAFEQSLVLPLTDAQADELEALLAGVTPTAPQIPAILAGQTIPLYAFYQPVLRADGIVDTQYPEWYDDPTKPDNQTFAEQGKAHTFERNDLLALTTEFADDNPGPTFQFQLSGGSTFDSDVLYNGLVDNLDLLLIESILTGRWPTNPGEPAWDPTTDINVRFANGAQQTTGLVWPLPTSKEIGLGDYGPLNVEFDRHRNPFLDLDADNSSGARGVDFNVNSDGTATLIAAADARFANATFLDLAFLTIKITNSKAGDQLRLDTSLPSGVTLTGNGTTELVITGIADLNSYTSILANVRYSSTAATPAQGVRVISVVATGGDDFTLGGDQRTGNTAYARVRVAPVTPPPAPLAAIAAADEPAEQPAALRIAESPAAPAEQIAHATQQSAVAEASEVPAMLLVAPITSAAAAPTLAVAPAITVSSTAFIPVASTIHPTNRTASTVQITSPVVAPIPPAHVLSPSAADAAWWAWANMLESSEQAPEKLDAGKVPASATETSDLSAAAESCDATTLATLCDLADAPLDLGATTEHDVAFAALEHDLLIAALLP